MYRFVTALFLMLVSACGSPDPQPVLPAPPPLEKVTIALQARVKLEPPLAWTPTHFAPVFFVEQSVSEVEKWPLNGDKVDVICRDDHGDKVLDATTRTFTTVWYRIRVPKEKVDPQVLDAIGLQAREIEGGYNAYIQKFYLQLPEGKEAPAC